MKKLVQSRERFLVPSQIEIFTEIEIFFVFRLPSSSLVLEMSYDEMLAAAKKAVSLAARLSNVRSLSRSFVNHHHHDHHL